MCHLLSHEMLGILKTRVQATRAADEACHAFRFPSELSYSLYIGYFIMKYFRAYKGVTLNPKPLNPDIRSVDRSSLAAPGYNATISSCEKSEEWQ